MRPVARHRASFAGGSRRCSREQATHIHAARPHRPTVPSPPPGLAPGVTAHSPRPVNNAAQGRDPAEGLRLCRRASPFSGGLGLLSW